MENIIEQSLFDEILILATATQGYTYDVSQPRIYKRVIDDVISKNISIAYLLSLYIDRKIYVPIFTKYDEYLHNLRDKLTAIIESLKLLKNRHDNEALDAYIKELHIIFDVFIIKMT